MTSEQVVKARGRGRIQISATLWDEIGKPETPEAWHKALLLPENYEVERVELLPSNLCSVRVLSEDIPVVHGAECVSPIEVSPYYRKHEDGRVELTHIDMSCEWVE